MGDILKFPNKLDPKTLQLLELGNDIDQLLYHNLRLGLNSYEVCAVISHRLGSIIDKLPDKDYKVDVLLEILLSQAKLDTL